MGAGRVRRSRQAAGAGGSEVRVRVRGALRVSRRGAHQADGHDDQEEWDAPAPEVQLLGGADAHDCGVGAQWRQSGGAQPARVPTLWID